MSAKVLQFVRKEVGDDRPRRLDERKLDAAYAALHGQFTEVMMAHAADDVGVLALVRFTADVLAEVSAHKSNGPGYLEFLLGELYWRAHK